MGEVYVSDLTGGQVFWASTNAALLTQGLALVNPMSSHPMLSDDGTVVAFKTGSTSGTSRAAILQFNVTNQSTLLISTNGLANTFYGDDDYGPEMTPDGRFVAFVSKNPGSESSPGAWKF